MAESVLNAVHRELALDSFIASARTVALGVSALSHKAVNDSVKGKTVVKALFYKLFKVFAGQRRFIGIKSDNKLFVAVVTIRL